MPSISFLLLVFLASCSSKEFDYQSGASGNWLLPFDKIVMGAEFDAIPALTSPTFTQASEVEYLAADDLVLGIEGMERNRAYPVKIMVYHELVNDFLDGRPILISYCPLTATGMAFNRTINGEELEFGVSGLLYNSNLIMFDRQTKSYWSQIYRLSVFGEYEYWELPQFPMVEMEWQKWKELYPDSEVLSEDLGYPIRYDIYPYPGYQTDNDFFLFPIDSFEDDFASKTKISGAVVNDLAYLLRMDHVSSREELENVNGSDISLIALRDFGVILSYRRTTKDGRNPKIVEISSPDGVGVMVDELGNVYSIFGEVIEGPSVGDSLRLINTFSGYWFAWSVFYQRYILAG